MPAVIVNRVVKEGGTPTLVGSMSCKVDDSFHDFRRKLEDCGTFQFQFQFIDTVTGGRMPIPWEKMNNVCDYGSTIQVIPQLEVGFQPRPDLDQIDILPCAPQLVSSNASNAFGLSGGGTVSVSPGVSLPDSTCPWEDNDMQEVNTGDNPPPGSPPQNEFLSNLMNPLQKKLWQREASKLQEFMNSSQSTKGSRWRVQTWDNNQTPMGKILCLECDHSTSGSSKGVMEPTTITRAFTNFKKKHLDTAKHKGNLEKRLKVAGSRPDQAPAEGVTVEEDERAILNAHVGIVQAINDDQPGEQPTFRIMGDVHRQPLLLNLFRVRCVYCYDQIVLVPQQRNLKFNLSQHCASAKHISAYEKSCRKSSGEPVVSGRPGRPRAADKRDVKQRTIGAWFVSDRGDSGQSSQSTIPSLSKGKGDEPTLHQDSQLCWGLWQDKVGSFKYARPVKEILNDLEPGKEWYSEPYVRGFVFNPTSQIMCEVKGTFRHVKCSRVSDRGGGFQDMTCEHCWSIQHQQDFRLRVLREEGAERKRGTRDTSYGLRLGYMTKEEIVRQGRLHSANNRQQKLQIRRMQHRILMLQVRVPRLREICQQSLTQREVNKFCNSIVLAHKNGAFGGREALWDLMRDVASNINRSKKGQRYSKGTKLICQALYQHGGRRVVDCLADNMIGPSLVTLQRDRKGMTYFRSGIHVDQFKFVANIYSQLKTRFGIVGPLPVILAEDETCVKKQVRWLPKQDSLLGFCGKKSNHVCIVGLEVEVGDGEPGFKNISTAFEENVVGHQARVIMVNPLHEKLPRVCLMATSTCNKFDAGWVRQQWNLIAELWKTHCLSSVGPLVGHASDGDSRRRKLMLDDFTGKGMVERRQDLGWEGWPLTHSFVGQGDQSYASRLHDQDFIHNAKKLINPLDSPAKILKLGSEIASISHLVQVYRLYSIDEHGMTQEDIKRTDRQNWASAQRLCSRKVTSCLSQLRSRKDARTELCAGSEMYLTICADYVDIFLNQSLTLKERVKLCGKVSFFFRLWRLWIFHGNHTVGGNQQPITMNNCVSMQTFLDVQMSVHFVVLLIIQFRDKFPSFPVPLHLTGSDSCEQFFSKVGGMRGHERSYDLSELVDCATSLNRLVSMDLMDGIHGIGKSHKKHRNIWMRIHYGEVSNHQIADLSDYSGISSNAEVISVLKEGFCVAQDVATRLQMNPSTSARITGWWTSPWIIEARGSKDGGWCDIQVEALPPSEDIPEAEVVESTQPRQVSTAQTDEETWTGAPPNGNVVESQTRRQVEGVMSSMECQLNQIPGQVGDVDIKPTVTIEGKIAYKSTIVAELNENPGLSKDRLTRVKQTAYFNNLVDKPRIREGVPTMFMAIGMDCGVFFLKEPEPIKETRTRTIVKALGGKRKRGAQGASSSQQKKSRGIAAPVTSVGETDQYTWWIGRVQSIKRKYNSKWARCRESVDLLDRPATMDVVTNTEVQFNWFNRVGRCRFKYNMCDPQWISQESIISTIHLSVKPERPDVFILDEHDAQLLDDYVKNKSL